MKGRPSSFLLGGRTYSPAVSLLLALPFLLFILLAFLLPLGMLLRESLFAPGFTAEHYRKVFDEPVYLRVMYRTVRISVFVTLISLLLGYPLALLMARARGLLLSLLLISVLLPLWTSVLVRTYAWLVLLQREGVINSWLLGAGLISQPLELVHNMLGTVIGMVHVMLPFLILPLYASMKTIDPALLLAAANCGASPTRAFRQVFLPLSMPGLAAGVGLTFVLCLGFYLTPALLGGGKVAMWSMQIADNIALYGNWGAASALGVVLLVVTAIVLFGLRRVFRVPGAGGGE